MARTVKVPVLGQSVEEVRIVRWLKQVGESVTVGEPIGEIETDKTNIEFESPEAGVILQILAAPDSYVAVETPVMVVGELGEALPDERAAMEKAGTAPAAASAPNAPHPAPNTQHPTPNISSAAAISPRARRLALELGVDIGTLAGGGSGPDGRVIERDILAAHAQLEAAADAALSASGRGPKASPLARAVAAGSGLDLASVAGTGSGGRIVADDVRAVSSAATTPDTAPPAITPAAVSTDGTRTIALTGLRKRVADNLSRSVREKPHVTLNASADMTEAIRLRAQLIPAIELSVGVKLSPTDILVKACALALREHGRMNAHIDNDSITVFDAVHIGLAVSLGDDGLMVPVIRDAHTKGLAAIAKDRQELASLARDGKLTSAQLSGGTFTITNLGNYGIESFNPIIPPPQVAILGVGAIIETVVALNGAPAVRPRIGISLSFDHRAVDGAPAAAFLARVREILENPYLLLV